jgi:hypothetical protein
VDRVRREFPRVSLSFSTGWSRDLLERVRARGLDGAVVLLPDSERLPAGLDATRLGQERLVVVEARRGRARAFGLASLSDAGWILNPEGCAARALLQRALLAANLRLRVAVETYTYELQLALVARERPRAGLGPHSRPEPAPLASARAPRPRARLPADDLGGAGARRAGACARLRGARPCADRAPRRRPAQPP